jgi:DNA-binding GntR family transcriptional regulator
MHNSTESYNVKAWRERFRLSDTAIRDQRDNETAPAKVYGTLRFQIVEGEIPPNTRVNIDAMARRLGVSQTPVREALQRLEGDGLLVYRASKGYSTTPKLDLQGLRSLFEFRLLVEPWAARCAAVDTLSNPAAILDAETDAFQERVNVHDDVRPAMLTHDMRFHSAIIAAPGNSVVEQAYLQTHCHLHLFRLYPVDLEGTATVEEHREIGRAIRECRPDDAEALMAKHIRLSFGRYAQAFADPDEARVLRSDRRASMVQ